MYKLIGKIVNVASIVGYLLQEEDNKIVKLKVEDTLELMSNGLVENFSIIEYNNERKIYSKDESISSLKTIYTISQDKYEATKAIKHNNETIGLMLSDGNKELRVTLGKAWDIAVNNGIRNIEAYVSNEKKIIKGKGIQINNMQSISV